MGRIVLDEEEERELALYDRTNARWLPGARGPGSTLYHNPRTGQEFRLPFDSYSIARYSSRGLVLGRAPDYLRELYANTPKKVVAGVVEGPMDAFVPQAQTPPANSAPPATPAASSGDATTLAILEALTALTKEVKDLRGRVDGTYEPEPEPARQLSLF